MMVRADLMLQAHFTELKQLSYCHLLPSVNPEEEKTLSIRAESYKAHGSVTVGPGPLTGTALEEPEVGTHVHNFLYKEKSWWLWLKLMAEEAQIRGNLDRENPRLDLRRTESSHPSHHP